MLLLLITLLLLFAFFYFLVRFINRKLIQIDNDSQNQSEEKRNHSSLNEVTNSSEVSTSKIFELQKEMKELDYNVNQKIDKLIVVIEAMQKQLPQYTEIQIIEEPERAALMYPTNFNENASSNLLFDKTMKDLTIISNTDKITNKLLNSAK